MIARIACCVALLAAARVTVADDPKQADLAKKPQHERILKGEIETKATELQNRLNAQQSQGSYAEARATAEELLALLTKSLGADHWQTREMQQDLADVNRMAKLTAEQSQRWRESLRTSNLAAQKAEAGSFATATPVIEAHAKLARELFGSESRSTAIAINNFGYNLHMQKRYPEAVLYYTEALEIHRKTQGNVCPTVAISWSNIALALDGQRKFDEAEKHHRQCIAILLACRGEHHAQTSNAYRDLADNLESQLRYRDAESILRKRLEILEARQSEPTVEVATAINNLAFNLRAQGRHSSAEELLRKALIQYEKLHGPNHPNTATALNNIAVVLNAQYRPEEAETLNRRALEIRRKALGATHPETLTSINNLAATLKRLGRQAQAEPLFRESYTVRRQVHGPVHESVALAANNLASCLQDQGKFVEAEPFFHDAIRIFTQIRGESHPDTMTPLNNLGLNLIQRGDYANAYPVLRRVVQQRTAMLGETHPDTIASASNLANCLQAAEQYEEATQLLNQVLASHREMYGEEHPKTATSMSNLANCRMEQEKLDGVETLLRQSLVIRQSRLAPSDPALANSHASLGGYLLAVGRFAESEAASRTALKISRQVFGSVHPDTVNCQNLIAMTLHAQGRTTEAIAIVREAIPAADASRSMAATGFDRASLNRINPRLLLAVMLAPRDPEAAWEAAEQTFAQSLFEQIQQRRSTARPDQEQLEQQKWAQQIQVIQTELATLLTRRSRTDAEQKRIDELLTRRSQFERRSAEFANAATRQVRLNSEAIRQQLRADAAIVFWLDLVTIGGTIQEHWGCVIRHEGPIRWVRLPASAAKPAWQMDDRRVLRNFREAILEGASAERRTALQRHFVEQRVVPLKQYLQGVTAVQILATSEFAGVPLDPILSDFAVSYLPAASWRNPNPNSRSSPRMTLLAMGDPMYPVARSSPDRKNWPTGGVFIKQVLPGSAAARAGLRVGDVLLDYAREPVANHEQLVAAIKKYSAKNTNTLRIWREGQTQNCEVSAGKLGVGVEDSPAPQSLALAESAAKLARGGDWTELPGTAAEIAWLQSLFTDTTVLTRADASPKKLAELVKTDKLKDFRYLHFATHGEANGAAAFQSSLILHGDDKSVARLTAREILETWTLDADLVTLSACETAIGKDGGGDGLLGFAQAFLTAGARSVCLSLWKVDDTATALLMSRFYENLLGKREGLSKPMGKATSLDEAKRWLRNLSSEEALALTAKISNGVARGTRGKGVDLKVVATETKNAKPYAHPKYWAAFILIGDPN